MPSAAGKAEATPNTPHTQSSRPTSIVPAPVCTLYGYARPPHRAPVQRESAHYSLRIPSLGPGRARAAAGTRGCTLSEAKNVACARRGSKGSWAHDGLVLFLRSFCDGPSFLYDWAVSLACRSRLSQLRRWHAIRLDSLSRSRGTHEHCAAAPPASFVRTLPCDPPVLSPVAARAQR